ncbi:hypothetical protein BJ166DRAFT_535610 [Pestalotiopsis sp. NC0098]|nr:hypothetical protein BJ166DRAFT_535610 [Pestalotiopsis sp. NC0098]
MAPSVTTKVDYPSSTSLYLPSQTTPFSYNGPGCTPSVFCADLTTAVYAETAYQFGVSLCFGVNAVGSAVAPLTTATYMAYNNFCMPENYYELFGDARAQAVYNWPHGTQEGARSTLAYPGTACPNGWSPACTTTLVHEGAQYPQAWCCPSEDYQCTTGVGDSDSAADPQRLCVSAMSGPTEVWMSFDPATTLSNGQEAATWHTSVPGTGALVYHKVFPLSLTAGAPSAAAESGGGGFVTTVTTTVFDSSFGTKQARQASMDETKVATVAAAGTITGAVAVVGFATWALLRHRKKRRHAKEQATGHGPADAGEAQHSTATDDSLSGKGENAVVA